jgi:hypothetical protein
VTFAELLHDMKGGRNDMLIGLASLPNGKWHWSNAAVISIYYGWFGSDESLRECAES